MFRILESNELISGNTQQALADRWWVQTLSTSVTTNPFAADDDRDPRGRRGSVARHENFNQDSPDGVSFLGGTILGTIASPAKRTIIGQDDNIYFAPFANQPADNTTEDSSPEADFPGGFALTPQHLEDLSDQGLNPRIFSNSFLTLLDVVKVIADTSISEQFIEINGADATPPNIEDFRKETQNLAYLDLPRHTGVLTTEVSFSGFPEDVIVADPDLGENLEDMDPSNDEFPTLEEINPSLENFVVPFVQAGDYFGLELSPGAHTVRFGANFGSGQDVTYNILNPINGTNRKDFLIGTKDNDFIDGGNGKDILLGKEGDDLILGGSGRDILFGNKGDDELWGDGDRDLFIYKYGDGMDKIFDLTEGEKIKALGIKEFEVLSGLSNGFESTIINFGEDDSLTIIGIVPEDLKFSKTFFGTTITLG